MMTFNGELLEIFSRVPANHLYKLLSVCTSFFELFTNDFFRRKQFKYMQLLADTDYFVEPDHCQRSVSNKLEVRALCSNNFYGENISGRSLPQATVECLAQTSRIIASSNGLLCCRNVRDAKNPMFLFNPTTRSYLSVPSPDELSANRDFNVIFECDKSEDSVDYLLMALVLVECPDGWNAKFHSKIFLPQEKVWKDGGIVDIGARGMIFEFSVFLNGVVYMVSDNSMHYLGRPSPFYWPYIVAYDIKKSSSKFLKIPKHARKGLDNSKLGIFKWGTSNSSSESICLVKLSKNAFTVWVLTNNEHTGSSYYWSRVFKMRVKAMVVQNDSGHHGLKVIGFTVANGSTLLFATQDMIYRYDLMNGESNAEFECRHEYEDSVRFTSFSSTLRPSASDAITLSPEFRETLFPSAITFCPEF